MDKRLLDQRFNPSLADLLEVSPGVIGKYQTLFDVYAATALQGAIHAMPWPYDDVARFSIEHQETCAEVAAAMAITMLEKRAELFGFGADVYEIGVSFDG